MAVDGPGGEDLAVAGDDLGRRADHQPRGVFIAGHIFQRMHRGVQRAEEIQPIGGGEADQRPGVDQHERPLAVSHFDDRFCGGDGAERVNDFADITECDGGGTNRLCRALPVTPGRRSGRYPPYDHINAEKNQDPDNPEGDAGFRKPSRARRRRPASSRR